MKIYMNASLRANPKVVDTLIEVADYLKSKGHSVDTKKLTDPIESKPDYNDKELTNLHRKMMHSIKQCDVMISEISEKSSGLGYEIAVALNEKKPILALYYGSPQEHSSLSLKSNPSKLLQIKRYGDGDINELVEEFLKDARDKMDTKFILIISPEIDRYLAWASEERRMHKAQVVRNAVEDAMRRDKDYQTFLKNVLG